MSQIVTRKGPVGEDKDKRQTDSPVKEMKKKLAANAEKEKQTAERQAEKSEKSEKSAHNDKEKKPEKASEKDKDKTDKKDKLDKSVEKRDKSVDKKEKLDKSIEKKDKAEKSGDKKEVEKKENAVEKEKVPEKAAEEKKEDKSSKEKDGKVETEEKSKKPEPKAKENGAKVNGEQNGDTVKTARTPETPRPASDKLADKDYVPEDSKLLKLKDDIPASDRKLRSADSPKPHEKTQTDHTNMVPVVVLEDAIINQNDTEKKAEESKSEGEKASNNAEERTEREIDVVVEVVNEDEGRVKADTNYSKSRVKVSPYRRSARLADHNDTSTLANYTGNNTTMEMDITETSSFISEEQLLESPYLSGLRSIRGRRSYKPLREMTLRSVGVDRSARSNTSAHASNTEQPHRPTGTVVGRKRKPSHEESLELASEADEAVRGKRARLLERLARPFRLASTPLPARRPTEIVGINTDLPLSAPVATADTFDPEAIKPPTPVDTSTPVTPVNPVTPTERDSKRCVIM